MNAYAKAIVGAVLAGLSALGVALTDGTITGVEWVTVAAGTVGALAIIWGVPNSPAKP